MQNVPDESPSQPAEAGSPLAQLWRNIWPWDDLNAKQPPERWLSLGAEVLPALAVLAAQGPDKPRLLQTDLLARLLTVGSLNAVDKAAAAAGAGQSTITVNNPNLFAPGSWVAIVPAAGAATLTNSQFYQVLGPGSTAGTLTLAPNLAAIVNPGDYVVSVPAVWIAGQSLNVQVGNSVNIGTLPPISIAAAQSVNIGNSVAVGSLPPITIAAAQNVGITGTVSVAISSGSVTITGTPNVNIQSQSVVVNVALPWTAVGSTTVIQPSGGTFVTSAVPTGTQTLGLAIEAQAATITGVSVRGNQTNTVYLNSSGAGALAGWLMVPVNGQVDSTYTVVWNSSSGVGNFTLAAFASALNTGYPSIGAKPMSASVPVAIATDQTAVPTVATQLPTIARNTNLTPTQTLVAARQTAFAQSAAAIGTYIYDMGENPNTVGALVIYYASVGAGTVTFALIQADQDLTAVQNTVISSTAIAAGGSGILQSYPGATVVANAIASQIVGHRPRVSAVVATSAMTFYATIDLAP